MSDERYGVLYSDESISVLRPSTNTPEGAFRECSERHGEKVVRLKIEILAYVPNPAKVPEPCPTCGKAPSPAEIAER